MERGRFGGALAGGRRSAAWLLLALVAVSVGIRAWVGLRVSVPWIAPDEMVYGLVGQSLYRSGSLDILGGPTPYYSAIVPTLAGAPLSLGDLAFGYDLLKVSQAVIMSLTAVPVYLWGRSLVSRRYALLAAALTLVLPALVYSGLVMTEVVFYPAVVLAAWAAARALEQPTAGRQAVLAAAVAFAVLTRLQALVLVPAILTALGVDAALQRSARTLRRFVPTFALTALLILGWTAWRLAVGGSGLGGYDVTARGGYVAGRAARFVLYHAGSVTIMAGVLPVCALLLLLIAAVRRGESSPARRAFLAVAVSFLFWLVIEVGVFASRYVGQLAERDLIGLAPVLFLAFALWLDQGGPRGYWPMSLVAVAVAAPLTLMPLDRLVTRYAPPDAPSLAALYDLRSGTSLATLQAVFYIAVAAAILVFALVPKRALAVLPVVLLAVLAAASVPAAREAIRQSSTLRTTLLGPDRRWIDHHASGPVAYLFGKGDTWVGVWESLFWNRRIERVYVLGGAKVFGPLPQRRVRLRPDGSLLTAEGKSVDVPYVVAPLGEVVSVPTYSFRGEMVAYTLQSGGRTGGLALWHVPSPLRLFSRTTGLSSNGDIYAGGDGRIVAYGCPAGVFKLTLLIKQPQTMTILRNRQVYRRLQFASPTVWRGAVPTAPPPGGVRGRSSCSLDVRPSALVGTTVFQVQEAPNQTTPR